MAPMHFRAFSLLTVVLCATVASAAEPLAADLEFFEKKIRPVLVAECYSCHSAEAAKLGKLKGGLSLDSREASRRGGKSGPAVVPGKVDESLLVSALKHESFSMPPQEKLSTSVVADFEHWIRRGAPDPREEAATKTVGIDFDQARREHWAFQSMQSPAPPKVRNPAWVRNDVDAFILSKLEERGLAPSPEADRRTWLRRVTFDLIGLPPSPDEIAAFVDNRSPDAYERVVDRLLASPHYGERWGRHWLDLARYADTNGYHEDRDRPNAWRYRDYVIDSFNADKPFARFTAEQLAGDELPDANDETLIATGFNCNAPSNEENMGVGKFRELYRLNQLDEIVSTTATVFLGLSIGCARCHDHKTDPISAEDYYRFLAVFNNAEKAGTPKQEKSPQDRDEAPAKLQTFIETSAEVQPTYLLQRGNLDLRGPEVQPGVPRIVAWRPFEFPVPKKDAKTTGRRRALAEWIASPENPLTYRVLANRLWQHHFGRGIVSTPSNFGLTGAEPTHPELLDYLAQQIIADGGRLKAVQRLIVTSATYRQASGPPTQNHLAAAFTAHSSARTTDPQNDLLSHFPLQRLEAEALRDAILFISGNLNFQRGGPGIKPRIRAELLNASQRNRWPTLEEEGPNEWRRSVYIYVKRQLQLPMMELFDAPTTTISVADRGRSVLPTQALLLMNDEFIEEQARYAAERMLRESDEDVGRTIERLSVAVLTRSPTPTRNRQALDFVNARYAVYLGDDFTADEARLRAIADLAHVLFNSNEFVYVE